MLLTTKKNREVWTKEERKAWKRPERISASEWADKCRVLDPRTSAESGRWKTARTPYLKGIMDALTDPLVEEITVMSASQVGKTESMLNMIGYIVDQDPGPTLIVLPKEDDVRSLSFNRVMPMLNSSEELRRHLPRLSDKMTRQEYHLDRMTVYFASSNSPSDLASRPVRYLFMDEIDKYPRLSGREADPIKLASERQKTYWNKKTVKVSTPTTREGYIFREFEKSSKHRYYVPCPHCGKEQLLLFGGIKWPKKERNPDRIKTERLAWYECFECGERIEDYHKPEMLAKGMWVYEESDDDKRETDAERRARSHHKGFTINSLYSPWLSWSDIASEFIKSKEETELLMNFVNSWLAEVWEEKIEETTVDKVKVLAKDYTQGEVPGGVIVLTAGVDVQKDHFYYVIRGWGYQEESWLVRTGRVEYWEDVADILFKTEYRKITGPERLSVYMSCIDSGYRTDEVYRFCREWPDKAKAIKGQDEISGGRFYRASKIDINSRTGAVIKRGLVLWNLNVSQYKNKISRLVSSKDPQKWHIFKDISDDYLAQFTSEHKILIRNKNTGRAKEEWRKKKEAIANHYLDAEVYAVAAADIIRALNIRTDKAVKVYKENEETMDSRQNWIRKREGTWL